jgi:acetyltransferase-like isoleucine patch superfamily enzyme
MDSQHTQSQQSNPGEFYVHATSVVSPEAVIGRGTRIWLHCQVREHAVIGENCILSKGVYIDYGVSIGNNVKIQNGVSVYHGVTLEDGVFVGPYVCFTNDLYPRAINPDDTIKGADDWVVSETLIQHGAALGANSTIRCGITIGRWAMVGAGTVVTRSVPDYGLVVGNPGRLIGYICPCGTRLEPQSADLYICPTCNARITIKNTSRKGI